MKNSVAKDFVVYDYLSIDVNPEQEQLYVDCYQNFGWEFVSSSGNNLNQDYYVNNPNINQISLVKIKFKRDRKIKNKAELLILQKKMESTLKKNEKLTKEPEMISTMYSMIIGVIGLLFFVFGVLSYIASNPLYILAVLNGIIGIIGFAAAFLINGKVKKQKQEENEVLIEKEYDLISEYCEKANKLIG